MLSTCLIVMLTYFFVMVVIIWKKDLVKKNTEHQYIIDALTHSIMIYYL